MPDFENTVKRGWSRSIQGCRLYKIRTKMKYMKADWKDIAQKKSYKFEQEITDARKEQTGVQQLLQHSPFDQNNILQEQVLI